MITNKNLGFTLLEVLIAVVIVAILATIGTNSYFRYIIDSKISIGQKFIQDIAELQERHFSANKIYLAAIPSSYQFLPDALQGHYSAPSIFFTTTHPRKFAIALSPNLNSPLMGRFDPENHRPSALLLINSEFERWFETDPSCLTSCDCIFNGNDRYWEGAEIAGASTSDWVVGSRTPTTAGDTWVCTLP